MKKNVTFTGELGERETSFPRNTIRERQHKIVFFNFFPFIFTIWEHELMPVNRFVSPFNDQKLMSRALNHSPLYLREFFFFMRKQTKKRCFDERDHFTIFFSVSCYCNEDVLTPIGEVSCHQVTPYRRVFSYIEI